MKHLLLVFCFTFFLFISKCFAIPLTWGDEVTAINEGDNPSDGPVMRIAPDGGAIALWIQSSDVKVSIYDATSETWSSPATIATNGSFNPPPDIGVGSSTDEAVAIYSTGGSDIRVIERTGGSWGSDTSILSGRNRGVSPSHIAMNTSNEVAVILSVLDTSPFADVVEHRRRGSDGTWEPALGAPPELLILNNGAENTGPEIAINESGDIAVSWTRGGAGSATLFARQWEPTSFPTGTWTPVLASDPETLATSVSTLTNSLGIDSSGNLYTLSNTAGLNLRFRAIVSGALEPLGGPTTIATGIGSTFTIAVNAGGSALAIWENGSSGIDASFYNTVSWGSTETISVGNSFLQNAYSSLAIDDNDNGIAMVRNTTESEVQIINYVDGEWQTPEAISTTSGTSTNEALSVTSDGTFGVAAWDLGVNINANAGSSASSPDTPEPPTLPGGAQKSNNFGVFTENYNLITWTPSVSGTVLQYQIYRDNDLIDTVSFSQHSYIDHNRLKGEVHTYQIFSVDSVGNVSTTAANVTVP